MGLDWFGCMDCDFAADPGGIGRPNDKKYNKRVFLKHPFIFFVKGRPIVNAATIIIPFLNVKNC